MKISVALCTYNGEKYIEKQLTSILNQTIVPDEIIICDDNSSDSTERIVKNLMKIYDNIYFYKNASNINVIKNFENAISRCCGDIIFTADQDDVWMIDKVENVINVFNEEGCWLVFHDAKIVDSKLEILENSLFYQVGLDKAYLNNSKDILKQIIYNNKVTGACMALKRELVPYIFPFSEYVLHDQWIAIMASLLNKIYCYPSALILYRQHENNVIGENHKLSDDIIQYFKKITRMRETREIEYKLTCDVIDNLDNKQIPIDTQVRLYINNWSEFWKDMCLLSSSSRLKGLKIILKNHRDKKYQKYYTGFRGVFRDFLAVFLRK